MYEKNILKIFSEHNMQLGLSDIKRTSVHEACLTGRFTLETDNPSLKKSVKTDG